MYFSFIQNSFCYNENMTFHGEIKGFVELVPAVETGIEDQNMTVYPVVLCDQRKPGDENSAACAYKLDVCMGNTLYNLSDFFSKL